MAVLNLHHLTGLGRGHLPLCFGVSHSIAPAAVAAPTRQTVIAPVESNSPGPP
jgi:hypothetical protein